MIYTEQKRLIMHIDYDSFFASVEQQANRFLRGKPISVGGSSLTKGIVCAASREAKKFGIKTGMPNFKARELCPNLISIRGDATKYIYIQHKSLQIFAKYSDFVEPFSIDEAFLDITSTIKFFSSIQHISNNIKEEIKKAFGEYVTCSIGVGPNKLMAKLASDKNKPNGLCIINEENMQHILKETKLTDFCGIGKRIEARLNNLGVFNVQDLQNINPELLFGEFGNEETKFLRALSIGRDSGTVKHFSHQRIPKSIGHQHTLSRNTKDPKVIKNNLRRLAEMVAQRLRKKGMHGKTISLHLRDTYKTGHHDRETLFHYTQDGYDIYKTALEIMQKIKWNKEIRLIGISISNLIPNQNVPLYLFRQERVKEGVMKAIDIVNSKFGDFTAITADTLQADRTKGKISSFLKH